MKQTLVNLNKLKGKMVENQINTEKLAICLNISYAGLLSKFSGRTEFKDSEIAKMVNLFGDYILNLPNK